MIPFICKQNQTMFCLGGIYSDDNTMKKSRGIMYYYTIVHLKIIYNLKKISPQQIQLKKLF